MEGWKELVLLEKGNADMLDLCKTKLIGRRASEQNSMKGARPDLFDDSYLRMLMKDE